MTNEVAQLVITADDSGAQAGFERVAKGARGMGQEVGAQADKAGKALKGMGDEASKEADKTSKALKGVGEAAKKQGEETQKVSEKNGRAHRSMSDQARASAKEQEAATRNVIASIQRQMAVTEAGEKGTAKYFETLAKQRGLDMAAIKPHLDAMRAMEDANVKVGMSAKATSAAMRTVPAQFTDIVTSLQGGQAPLTVFLQQGGQLKDQFGGMGNAAKALGGYVTGLINPFTVAAAGVGVLGLAYYKGSQEADEFRKSLILTGNAAGASVAQLAGMAESIGSGYGKTTGAAAAALAQLAATGEVGRASLKGFADTALEAESKLGIAVKDIAKNFADLGKDPAAASLKLNESMHYLTATTYEAIKAAQDMGQSTKAASIAQDAYNSALKARSAEVAANAGTIEKAWSGIKNAAAGAWDAMLGVGRPVTVGAQLSVAQKNLEAALEKRKGVGDDSAFAPQLDKEIAKLREQVGYITEIERMQKRAGDSAAERIAREEAGIKTQQDGLKYLSDEQKMRNDIAQQTATMIKAGKSQAEIEERIGQIRASYAKKGAGASGTGAGEYEAANLRAQVIEAQRYLDALQQTGTELDKLTSGEKAALKIREELKGNLTAAVRLQKEKALSEAEALANIQKSTDAERDNLALFKESSAANAKAYETATKRTETLAEEVARQREQNAALGLTKEATTELTAARLEDAAATAEQNAQVQDLINPAIAAELRAQAEQYRELARLKREGAGKEAASEAAKQAEAALKKTEEATRRSAEKVEGYLTDALMRGFESGKGFAENFRDTLKNMFATLVLRPVVQGVVGAGLGAFGLGLPGSASASTGANFATSLLGNYAPTALASSIFGSTAAYGAAIGGGSLAAGSQAAMLAAQTGGFGAAGTLATASAAGTGSSMMASAAAAGPYAIAAVAALNALGVFRSEKTVGGGIVGTLGANNVQSYDLQRRGGTLFNGPSYSVQGMAATAQTAALENAFVTLRTSTAQMAKDLGLSTDQVTKFTMAVGDVKVHPDINQLGLVLDGLSEPQKLEAINNLLQKSADGMAAVVLGAGATAQQLAQIYAATMQERKGLELQLLQVQGDTVEIRNRERAALQESNRALYDQINALQDSKAAAQAAAQAEAAIAQQRQGLQDQLDQLLGNTTALRERERNALDASNRALYDQVNALQDSRAAAEAATDNAWALVERSANAERTMVQARIDAAQRQTQTLGTIFSALKSGVDDLYRDTLSVQQQAAVQGRAFITQALATAQRTGYLPESEGLQSAIAAARAGMDGKQYASAFEQERDRLILAGELSQLKDITGEQLNESERMLQVAQQQLKGIDTQVALAKAQIDATQGVSTSVVSLSAAIQNLAATQAAARAANAGGAAGGASGAMAGLMPAGFVSAQSSSGTSLKDLAAALYGSVTTGYDSNKFNTAVNAYGGAQKAFASIGWDGSRESAARIAAAYGVTNVPKFAAGGLHSGGLRLVGEKGPELEVTGPARYYDANKTRDMLQGGGDSASALVQELQALRAQVARLEASGAATASNTLKTKDLLVQVTRDGVAMQTKPA